MATTDKIPDTLKRLRLFGLLARIDEVRASRHPHGAGSEGFRHPHGASRSPGSWGHPWGE